MGTETDKSTLRIGTILGKQVKLNNPLMGTETLENVNGDKVCSDCIVKLNNPLMGTETYIR